MPDFGAGLFARLQPQVAQAFERSDVKVLQNALGVDWHYDVTMLPFQEGRPLVLGLNPGVDESAKHTPQLTYPGLPQARAVEGWRFVRRATPRLRRFFEPVHDCNYFNLAPFRSKRANQLSAKDWQLGTEAFLQPALEAIRPREVVMLGTSGIDVARQHGLLDVVQKTHTAGNPRGGTMEVSVYVGYVVVAGQRYPFRSVPYPLFAMYDADHEAAWRLAFEEKLG